MTSQIYKQIICLLPIWGFRYCYQPAEAWTGRNNRRALAAARWGREGSALEVAPAAFFPISNSDIYSIPNPNSVSFTAETAHAATKFTNFSQLSIVPQLFTMHPPTKHTSQDKIQYFFRSTVFLLPSNHTLKKQRARGGEEAIGFSDSSE